MKKQISLALSILIFAVSAISAQEIPTKSISGGVINGKAVSLPVPEYPAAARAVKACGKVDVQVLIDEEGNIASANAVSGHPLLRENAENAALQAKFRRTTLEGNPVKVSGVIIYNFACKSGEKPSTETSGDNYELPISGGRRIGVAPNSTSPNPNDSIKTISGGVVNGKAVSMPKPEYPAAAQAVKAVGAVNVKILIDEGGNVIEATAVSGHPLLRQPAEQAARQAQFAPTMLSGQPVKVSGVIVYNFGGGSIGSSTGGGIIVSPAIRINNGKNKFFGLGLAFSVINENSGSENNDGSQQFIKNLSAELPQFADNFKSLESLDKNTAQSEKTALLDNAFSSIRNKLSQSEAWQFDTGKQLGKIMGAFRQARADGKFDETVLKTELLKLRDLTFTAPPETSADFLQKMKTLADFYANENLNEPETKLNLLKAVPETLASISR